MTGTRRGSKTHSFDPRYDFELIAEDRGRSLLPAPIANVDMGNTELPTGKLDP